MKERKGELRRTRKGEREPRNELEKEKGSQEMN